MDNKERASKGGYARAAKLTPEQRSTSARNAVNARWAKKRTPLLAQTETVTLHTPTFTFSWIF